MDEDTVLGLGIIIIWILGVVASLSIAGFICWGIYKLVTHFL